jgi:membrane-associated protease RseP (regulator of RpoE activity)
MLIRSLASILIVASSFVVVTGQTPDVPKTDADKAARTSSAIGTNKLRDIPFPAGVDLQFLIKELARHLDLNVLFDVESFRGPRKAFIDLKNVTSAEALDYILLQEGLYFEEAGPRAILIASRFRGSSIPQIGAGVTPLSEQLAQYFGVDTGILINTVLNNSPASKAGLKAGDVIVEIDGEPVKGALSLARAIKDKNENESDVILTIVRDRKRMAITVTPAKGIGSVVQSRGLYQSS